jgi:hypothetical protein
MWGKRKKAEKQVSKPSVSDKAAFGIARLINGMQAWFGSTLNNKTAHLSRRGKLALLIVFCLFFGGGSLYIMVDGFVSNKSSEIFRSKSIAVPHHAGQSGLDGSRIKALITSKDMFKIEQFRRYMDSLKSSKRGVALYDSIIKVRPGLMDSLTEVERLYGLDSSFNQQGQ